ncbi:hypothetical protein GOV09_03310 [Candidatus Woesearchaeota archaeon]|nr:hypothetical protein [Candidatus Woesearchaeota archaeon]
MTETQVSENKANIELLSKKIDALMNILEKEGITTKEELDSLTKELIEK